MPVLPVVANVLKMVMRGYVDGLLNDIWENVLHWRWTGNAPDSATLDAIAGQMAANWQTHMGPEAPSPTTLRNIELTDLTTNTGAGGEWNGVMSGTRGDDSIPANAAALISYPIDLRYRGGHPRTYLYVGGNADLQGASEWSNLFLAEYRQHWVDFLNAIAISSGGGMSFGGLCAVFYHGHGGPYIDEAHKLRVSPIVVNINYTNCLGHLEITSQRRRTAAPQANVIALKAAKAAQLLSK